MNETKGNALSRCLIAAVLMFAGAAHAAAPAKRVVLPDAVTPQHYRIAFTPDAQALTFKGSVEIDVVVHRATDRIVVNVAHQVIESANHPGEPKAPAVSDNKKINKATITEDKK
jgi:aminopeptidase N